MRRLIVLLSALVLCLAASAQTRPVREFRTTLDSVDVHIQERTTVASKLRLRSV